jgi:lipid-A-disaccharide synthase
MKFYIIAGEASGDFLGSQLIKALKALSPKAQFVGVGGDLMALEGHHSLFPMNEISLIGLTEVLGSLPRCYKRYQETIKDILIQKPDVLVTIDSPEFSHRVSKKVKSLVPHLPCVHYVAPTVWAWRPGRAKKIARHLDLLLTLFPFEPPFFEAHGLKTVFVGHPLNELILPPTPKANTPTLCVLPGSRMSEIKSTLPIFKESVKRLLENSPQLSCLLPTLPHLEKVVRTILGDIAPRFHIILTPAEKWQALQKAHFAVAASGTVSLELAKTNTPHLIAYKVNPITYLMAKMLFKTPFVGLVNIICGKEVVPELLQSCFTAENVTATMKRIREKGEGEQEPYLKEAINALEAKDEKGHKQNPSDLAAREIMGLIGGK